MGGKHKVANRTKNNARPSSSGRSASMLNSLSGFSGFSGVKESSGLSLFSFGPTEEFDSSVDESFQLVIKKISKKDSTTKLKGLQEFADLVKNAEPDAVKAVLPLWPRFYSVLVTDPENRVREATHNVQHEIVKKMRRDIAPFIKQIMAPWFTSQYDNYPPAATAAVQAFKETFSEIKFQEAIVYCQSEILQYIYENLSCQIDQNVAENSCHDIEAKYERILISCLQGYSLYLQKVPKETIEQSNDLNTKIVLNNSFWKLANSKISLIRSAWFQVLSVILQRAPFLLKNKESQVMGATLLYLEDDDPLVATHIWECLLLATSVIPDWWKYTNIEKKFIPKLLKVLVQAGQGNATIIYPNLLPLLSNLPLVDNERAIQFYDKFFEAIRSGLKLKSATSSKSESSAIAVALMECLKYTIMKNSSEFDMCKALIKNQLISVLEWCLTDKAACHKKIFTQTALFVQDLSGNSKASLNEALVIYFFDIVRQMFRDLFQSNPEHILLISERQLEFVRCFKQSSQEKQEICVKFALNNDENRGCHTRKVKKYIIQTELYSELMEKLGINIFHDYVDYITENLSKDLIKNVYLLVIAFNQDVFYESIIKKMRDDNKSAKYVDIYNNLFKKWLLSEKLCCKSVIELIFFLLPFLADKDKQMVLDDLIENGRSNCITWSISTALSQPHVEVTTVRNWLKNETVGEYFVSIAKKQMVNECSLEERMIFKQALAEHNSREPVLTKNVLKEIIAEITSTLLDNNTTVPTLDSCLRLAVDLCSIIYSGKNLLFYGETFLLTLFEISCRFEYKKENVLADTLLNVESAWQNALLTLIGSMYKEDCDNLLEKFAAEIDKQFRLASVAGKENVEHLGDIIVSCITLFYESGPCWVPVLNGLISDKFWNPVFIQVLWLCKAAEYLKGNLLTPYEKINFTHNPNEKEILQYFTWCYFKFYIMCSKLNTDEPRLVLDVISKKTEKHYLDILFIAEIGESFLTHYSNVKYHSEISHYILWMKKKSNELLYNLELAESKLPPRAIPTCDVKEALINMCNDDGDWFWIKVLYNVFLAVPNEEEFDNSYSNFMDELFVKKPLFKMHLKQFVCKNSQFVTNKIDEEFVKELIEEMENLRKESLSDFLYEDPKNMLWDKSYPLIQVVRKCAEVVKNGFWNQKFWDLLVVSMASWMSNCFKARSLLHSLQYQTMLVSVSELYMNTCTTIANFKNKQVNINYVNEWEDIVLENIHNDLVQIFLFLADELLNQSDGFITKLPLTQYFGPITEHIKSDLIFAPNDNLPKWTKFLKKSCSLLTSSQTILQLWGYRMLKTMIPGLIKIDTEAVNTNTPHRKGLIFEQFKEKLNEVENVVNSMLMDFKIGEDTCKVEPSYDSFTYTFAYLLLWDVMLSLFEHAAPELRYQYADWLKNNDILQSFLSNMFKLIPPEMSMHNEEKSKSCVDWFLNNPLDSSSCYGHSCDSRTIEQMVCHLYKSSLVQLPALVRQWWTDLEIKASQLVDKITILYVSPYLCTEELNDVIQCQNSFKNMKVRVLPGIREILAVYTIDETQMELTITLPVNYPLGSPTIQCNRQISGANQKQWLLQFKKCVLHQNGRIWDGLSLWNNNLDRKFDGVEECYICYAVLHFGTCQLPRLTCQTCKKKFHSACLYKWFSTSNKSSCPICRNWF